MDNKKLAKKNAVLSRSLAANSMVLLTNKNLTLPLVGTPQSPISVSVFGVGQIYTVKGGTGSGNVNNIQTISLLEALSKSRTLKPNPDLASKYRDWALRHENLCVEGFMVPKGYCNEEMTLSDAEIAQAAADSDAALMIISRVAGEGGDMTAGPGTIFLTEEELTLMRQINACFSRSILLLNTPGYLEIADVVDDFGACIFMGLPGQDAGSVVDILTGEVLPSGHLTDTWPRRYAQYPTADSFSKKNGNGRMHINMMARQEEEQITVAYDDDIYVGYRYFDTFHQDVLFPFGHGLTYSTSAISEISMALLGTDLTVSVKVENSGDVHPMREVVQVYLSSPSVDLPQPKQSLCAFGKTAQIAPGESELLTLSFSLPDCASYDESIHSYVLEPGYYYVRVGTNSRTTVVCGALFLPSRIVTLQTKDLLHHTPENFNVISPGGLPVWTYPGEEEELAKAKSLAIRLSPRDFTTQRIRYGKTHITFETGRCNLRLKDVAGGAVTLSEFVASMDKDDLCTLLCGVGMDLSGMEHVPDSMPFDGILGGGGMKVPGAAGETADLSDKYGIPPITLADGPAGIRIAQERKDAEGNSLGKQLCTAFPVGSLLACSWDRTLLEEFGNAVASEMLEHGVELWLSPGMNIHRNPLCGRNFEYFSEDPLLTGFCASAVTAGVQKNGVGVTIKHFAANSQENQRTNSNNIMTQRALREIYLRGFEYAVKQAQPYCIMTSYNDINGVPSGNNFDLCTALARDEWGFQGFIMTDWGGGISEPALSVCAGNDMLQPGGPGAVRTLCEALDSGLPVENQGIFPYSAVLTLQDVQLSASRILRVILRCRTAASRLS